jgi:hypothetical protein
MLKKQRKSQHGTDLQRPPLSQTSRQDIHRTGILIRNEASAANQAVEIQCRWCRDEMPFKLTEMAACQC